MKKFFLSLVLVGLGAAGWWITARTARFSVRKWDAKLETLVRSSFHTMGLNDQDLQSSIHEIRTDAQGEWVAHRVSLKPISVEKLNVLKKDLEAAGAEVLEKVQDGVPTLYVKRGSRVYQEISFPK